MSDHEDVLRDAESAAYSYDAPVEHHLLAMLVAEVRALRAEVHALSKPAAEPRDEGEVSDA